MTIDGDILLAARKIALDKGTSVNQLVREYLSTLAEGVNRKRTAEARLRKILEVGVVEVGELTHRRGDLYER